ncbi:MAG: type II toxin-antitoxin system prevent-host-death family antitoxin [Pseudomonadales bacterium]|jgi:prevent-host-death family protein|nr:type II toxin-antitoxin system prevent-host-death family antitoxin [Pseudomonadales bacterium]
MHIVNIREAKTHLSRLLKRTARGETVVIARAGRPIAKLVPLDTATPQKARRIGFLEGVFELPEDFDKMGEEEIVGSFDGSTHS